MFELWLQQLTIIFDNFVLFAPRGFGAVLLILIGLIVGGILKSVIKKFITRYKIDERLIKEKKPLITLGAVIPTLISWTIYLLFIQAALDILNIEILVNALNSIIVFIPRIVQSFVVVLAGYLLAQYAKSQIEKTKFIYCEIIGNILFFFVMYIAIALCLPLVGIDPSLLNNLLLIIVASFGLGIGLALGLGLKDSVSDVAKKYRNRKINDKK